MPNSLLNSFIDTDLRWREGELAMCKLQLLRDISDKHKFGFSYRCFVAITYAHYEGYVKNVAAQSLLHIRNSTTAQSCIHCVRETLVAPLLRKKINQMTNDSLILSISNGQIYDGISLPDEEIYLKIGNMNFSNLSWVLSSIGINSDLVTEYKPSVGRLVDLRHRCAHGEVIQFDSADLRAISNDMFKLQERIIHLLHAIAIEVVDLFEQQKFIAT
ncbi:MAE_28990/MAE_18760 family HEPN-like nuclease [Methylocystis sp. JR02]|uniref:MAE_28990/MAE_18760 family HEPN-like nuclease n=1 Tax=Methylocystis sp. JR02 TaxID=3046284 RepID=UPI0024BAF085|nr:MAE_28990/MAE_18760 family HEPN-like nuclease [Methylocystis sp. JR02]MDJ0450538.1 MAE_28990/MAE_18760 family HEPN-like nuclease [Methylocystis sp. JR02]